MKQNSEGYYTNTLLIGTPAQTFENVVFDDYFTGVWVGYQTCSDCDSKLYNRKASKGAKQTAANVSVDAGTKQWTGNEYTDKVCLADENNCVDSFNFIAASPNTEGLPPGINGMLGLSPVAEDSILSQLQDSKIISEALF